MNYKQYYLDIVLVCSKQDYEPVFMKYRTIRNDDLHLEKFKKFAISKYGAFFDTMKANLYNKESKIFIKQIKIQ